MLWSLRVVGGRWIQLGVTDFGTWGGSQSPQLRIEAGSEQESGCLAYVGHLFCVSMRRLAKACVHSSNLNCMELDNYIIY